MVEEDADEDVVKEEEEEEDEEDGGTFTNDRDVTIIGLGPSRCCKLGWP